MKHAVDYDKHDFQAEVEALFKDSNFNFGKDAIPIEIVKEATLKVVCGWHNGSTAQHIVQHLGYVTEKKRKITAKGKAFVWWAFGKSVG